MRRGGLMTTVGPYQQDSEQFWDGVLEVYEDHFIPKKFEKCRKIHASKEHYSSLFIIIQDLDSWSQDMLKHVYVENTGVEKNTHDIWRTKVAPLNQRPARQRCSSLIAAAKQNEKKQPYDSINTVASDILGGCFPVQMAEVVAATCRHLGKYVVNFLNTMKNPMGWIRPKSSGPLWSTCTWCLPSPLQSI